ncbi:MAG: AAA family ATPase [Roseiflexaceae bacterium]|nr:AAA family ATPase [Roseiflexus sp.]MDW8234018.1 AAA family ATPase [Roseiflexaceae bacterium]
MKLRRLFIDEYLLLRDLDLRFDRPGRLDTGSYALDFLVGVNGSGKSTVLRALAQIIADLRADRATDFSYVLEYELQGREGPYNVSIELQRDRTRRMTVRPSSEPGRVIFDSDAIDQSYLPNALVVHTTGNEGEWEQLMERAAFGGESEAADDRTLSDPAQRAIKELPGYLLATERPTAGNEAESPFLLVRATRLTLVTLCGLLAHLASPSKPLEEALRSAGIHHIRGFSLRFRLHAALSDFTTFNVLKRYTSRHIRQGNDHLLVFDLSSDPLKLASDLLSDPDTGGSLALFRKLDRLMAPGETGEAELQQINIFFERDLQPSDETGQERGVTRLLLLDWLSDGERSFLGRMAMLVMFDAEDSLILLDEPEVHFNDYWKRQIVALLNSVMQAHTNHLLIATHSSILLSDVTEGHITSLVRRDNGFAESIEFTGPTFGVNPSSIMVHVFDTGTAVGAFSAQYLASALDRNDPAELEELLSRIGVGYWFFRIQNRLERHRAS